MAGKKGFQHLSKEKRTEISRAGGIASQKSGRAHKYNSETAKVAGSLGGKSAQAKKAASKKLVKSDGSLMAAAVKGMTTGTKAPIQAPQAIEEGDTLSRSPMGDDVSSCGGRGGCGSSSS